MVVEHSQESDDDARERKRVEDRMEQLHVDAPNAAADTVQEHRWKLWYRLNKFIYIVQ